MRQALAVTLVLLAAGCKAAPTTPVAPTITRLPGSSQITTIQIQKYRNALFTDKSGKALDPAVAQTMAQDQVNLVGGDFDELFYQNSRLRYAYYARAAEDQPYVSERVLPDGEFDTLDAAFYTDKFFGAPLRTWTDTRLPLFVVDYQQGSVHVSSSYTPSLSKLPTLEPLATRYFNEMGGDAPVSSGVTQLEYSTTVASGTMTVAISEVVGTAGAKTKDGDQVSTTTTAVALTSVQVDSGAGAQAATVKDNTFSLPAPTGDGGFKRLALTVTPAAPRAKWTTVIPIRSVAK